MRDVRRGCCTARVVRLVSPRGDYWELAGCLDHSASARCGTVPRYHQVLLLVDQLDQCSMGYSMLRTGPRIGPSMAVQVRSRHSCQAQHPQPKDKTRSALKVLVLGAARGACGEFVWFEGRGKGTQMRIYQRVGGDANVSVGESAGAPSAVASNRYVTCMCSSQRSPCLRLSITPGGERLMLGIVGGTVSQSYAPEAHMDLSTVVSRLG